MALKKGDIMRQLSADHASEVERLEKMIDQKLAEDYAGRRISISLSGFPHERVRQELTRRYKEAGWRIKFDDDQRDGAFVSLE